MPIPITTKGTPNSAINQLPGLFVAIAEANAVPVQTKLNRLQTIANGKNHALT
ncbi:MAG: hypothetical protein IPI39_19225 [Candidatus Obscuribacter sp.]|nr:hypothetical protein [Candidatus Obscuribacter sp.]